MIPRKLLESQRTFPGTRSNSRELAELSIACGGQINVNSCLLRLRYSSRLSSSTLTAQKEDAYSVLSLYYTQNFIAHALFLLLDSLF